MAAPQILKSAEVSPYFRDGVIQGLSARPKTLSSKFLYDQRGCELFERICELPEYYLTRTECRILADHSGEIAARLGPHVRLVEFGSGAGIKVRKLLAALDRPAGYVPVDIAHQHLWAATAQLARHFPTIAIAPVCADYTKPLSIPAFPCLVTAGFFPGSTIGNMTPVEATAFLARTQRLLGPGAVMIVGVDLPKDEGVLRAAYDDSAGITAAFNLNLLERINRELGADFKLDAFDHLARWNEAEQRMEMHLVSMRAQTVCLGDHRFHFEPGETIHSENSHKYTVERFQSLARTAGYFPEAVWTDEDILFSVHLLRGR